MTERFTGRAVRPCRLPAGLALAVLALALVSCRADEPASVPDEAPRWELAAADLRIDDDGSGGPLPWVEALVQRPDGRIHSLHGRETFVRSWTSDGAPAGRPGADDPATLPDPRALGLLGDTLWVMDGQTHRVRLFGPDGAELGTRQASPGEDTEGSAAPWELPARPLRPLPGGDFLGVTPEAAEAVARGDQRRTMLLRMRADGSVLDTVWVRTWEPRDVLLVPRDGAAREGGGAYGEQPFADSPLWRATSDGTVVVVDRRTPPQGEEPAFHVTRLAETGDTLARATVPYDPVPLGNDRVEDVASGLAGSWREFRREPGDTVVPDDLASRIAAELFVPPHLPPVTDVVVASDGAAWLRRASGDAGAAGPGGVGAEAGVDEGEGVEADGTVEWWVMGPDGSLRARVSAPAGLRIHWAGPDHVLGSVVDAAGSVALVRHAIRR